jgi:Tol biopolymer transport system component/DNA-binding winged helix-turn-helix (wHTH) protein
MKSASKARFVGIELDLRSGELIREGRRLRLQSQPFRVLCLLLQRQGELVTREELQHEVWPRDTFVHFDHGLNKAIAKLRDVLNEIASAASIVETLPRRGYRLTTTVEWVEQEPAPAVPAAPPEPAGGTSRGNAISRITGRAALFSVAVIFLGLGTSGHPYRQSSLPLMRTIPLTSLPGAETEPAFSNDGEQVAFIWDEGSTTRTDVFVKRLGTEKPLQLSRTNGFTCCARWTSDDRYIAFERCSSENPGIFLVSSLGGPERKLRSTYGCNGLSLSPTGRLMVYAEKRTPDEPFALYLMSLDDMQPHQLSFPTGNIVGDMDPAFSPDGQLVAFMRIVGEGTPDVFVVPVAGGSPRQLTFDRSFVNGITWSADGSRVIFSSRRDGAPSLWAVSLDGSQPERLPLGSAEQPSVSRRGGRLAYRQGQIHPNLWQVDFSDRQKPKSPTQFLLSSAYNNAPQFSPDGKTLAFASQRSGPLEIWTCDVSDCAQPQQLTFLKGVSGTPRWSPDSKQIAFDSRPSGHSQIMVVDSTGGTPHPVTDGSAEDKVPSWSADGKSVYFASNRSGAYQIWRVPSTGGTPRAVTQKGGFAAFESSDGEFLYYDKETAPGIWRMPTSGGNEVRVLEDLPPEYWGNWTLFRDGIYYIRANTPTPGIEFLNFSSHEISRLANLPGLPPGGDPGFSVAADRKKIIFSQVDASSVDLMLVENFR